MRVNTKSLRQELQDLGLVAKSKCSFSIHSHVKIEALDRLELTITRMDETMVRKLDFDGEQMALCVSYIQLLNCIGDSEETMLIHSDGKLTVKCGSRLSVLATLPMSDFPETPDKSKFRAIGVPCADLAIGIRAVHGFEHKDRDNLTCTNIKGTGKTIECAATTGRELALNVQLLIAADFDYLVPSAFCDSLAEALDGKDAVLEASQTMLHVKNQDMEYFAKQGEGKYPSIAYKDKMVFNPVGMLETAPVINELMRCMVFREEAKTMIMKVEFSESNLWTGVISGSASLENNFAGVFKPCKAELNAESFLKCLKPFKDKVNVWYSDDALKFEHQDLTIIMGKMRPT